MEPIRNEITAPIALCTSRGRLNPEAIGLGALSLASRQSPRALAAQETLGLLVYRRGGLSFFRPPWRTWIIWAWPRLIPWNTRTNRFARAGRITPFGSQPAMPERVGEAVLFKQRGFFMAFLPEENGVRIEVDIRRFQGTPLTGEVHITRPAAHESLNVVVPWAEDTFQFTSKQHALPASGDLHWGNRVLSFKPGSAWATLDYGRGIWPYRTVWNWGAFTGACEEGVIGANLGGQWTDGTGANENGFILKGRLHKVFEEVAFEYDRKDFMRPWAHPHENRGCGRPPFHALLRAGG